MPGYMNKKDGYRFIGYDPNNFKDYLKFRSIILSIIQEPVIKTDLVIDALISAPLNQWEMLVLSMIINRYKTEKTKLIIRINKSDASKLANILGGKSDNVQLIEEV